MEIFPNICWIIDQSRECRWKQIECVTSLFPHNIIRKPFYTLTVEKYGISKLFFKCFEINGQIKNQRFYNVPSTGRPSIGDA